MVETQPITPAFQYPRGPACGNAGDLYPDPEDQVFTGRIKKSISAIPAHRLCNVSAGFGAQAGGRELSACNAIARIEEPGTSRFMWRFMGINRMRGIRIPYFLKSQQSPSHHLSLSGKESPVSTSTEPHSQRDLLAGSLERRYVFLKSFACHLNSNSTYAYCSNRVSFVIENRCCRTAYHLIELSTINGKTTFPN